MYNIKRWYLWQFSSHRLTHWGRVTHICVGKLTIIGSANGLSPGRRQAIIWTNAGILLIEPLGTNFSGILIRIQIFSFTKMRLKMSSAKWRPFCLGFNVLTTIVLWAYFTSWGGTTTGKRHEPRYVRTVAASRLSTEIVWNVNICHWKHLYPLRIFRG